MGRHMPDMAGYMGETFAQYAERKVPELDWRHDGRDYVYHAVTVLKATPSMLVIEEKPLIDPLGYLAQVRYPGNGTWHQYYHKKIRLAALGCLAKYLDGQEYWTRFLELDGAWWRRSKWKRDMRQLEREIFAQVLGMPKPSLEAGALSLTHDARGGLSLAQEVVQ